MTEATVTEQSVARRMFELVEPIGVIPFSAGEPNEAMSALGFTNEWDIYFAGRAAALGLVPAEVVDALFYNFAPGEVARHVPKVWRTTTPEAALAARQSGCAKMLRRILGDRVDTPAFAHAAELLTRAATSGLESHVLAALDMDMPAHEFSRLQHLPATQLGAVIDGMRDRGLIGSDGWLSENGRAVKQRVESLTDDLAAKPYESLEPVEIDELTDTLEPIAKLLNSPQDS